MRVRTLEARLLVRFALGAALWVVGTAYAQDADVPPQYRRHFAHYVDKRSVAERTLNLVNLTNADAGRSFALVAGVSDYPNMKGPDGKLSAAAEDIRKLENYLKQYEFFDEIVVLKNGEVTTENLEFFLQSYFPERLRKFPKSRFLFAYSGHGMTEGSSGYLLKNSAARVDDRSQAINLTVVRAFLDDIVHHGHHVLVLINACHSGAFLRRPFGTAPALPRYPGAHAITSGGSRELSWAVPSIGTGSVFFEKVFSALEGRADTTPADGIVTAYELASYLHEEVQFATNQTQTPQFADLTVHQSRGQFFFLNRERMVEARVVGKWAPDMPKKAMGGAAADTLGKAKDAFAHYEYTDALNLFLLAAQAGNTEAMGWLGYMYLNGRGTSQNYSKSFEWSEKSALAGHAFAINNLAIHYFDGTGVNKDYERARRWFEKAAAMEHADSMLYLGYIYEQGLGVTKNLPLAFQWYEKAVAGSSTMAMNNLGYFYQEGLGVKQDLAKATALFEKAAALGQTYAMRNLGDRSIDKGNYEKAIEWYEKGAAGGDAFSMAKLGYIYERGQGVKKSHVQAFVWYEKSAQLGNVVSMGNLGFLYKRGLGVRQDYSLALHWFEKAVATGDLWALAELGQLYRDGLGVRKDVNKGLELIKTAAFKNEPRGMAHLGNSYENGWGVETSYAEAFKWYSRAANGNYSWAMYRLGHLYENGLGVERNQSTAAMWYQKAAKLGDESAQERLTQLARRR